MTASTDAVASDVTYDASTRKITVAAIANGANGDAKAGKFERTITIKTYPGQSDINAALTVTIYITDPDCASMTLAFAASTLARTTYKLAAASGTDLSYTTVTATPTGCPYNTVPVVTSTLASAKTTFVTTTAGKVTWSVTNEDANIGKYTMSMQYQTQAATPANLGSPVTAPMVISSAACEMADVGTCTANGCSGDVSYTIGATALAAQTFTAFTLAKSQCKLDYVATTVPTALTGLVTTTTGDERQATFSQITDTKKVGIHPIVWTAKTIIDATAQTTTYTMNFKALVTACEDSAGAHVSVVTGKETQNIEWELDEATAPTWSKELTLSGIFQSTSAVDCFFTYGIDYVGTTADVTAVKAKTTFTHDAANSKVTISITEAASTLTGTAMGQWVLKVTAKSTGGVTYSPEKSATINLKAYYKKCKGASVITSVSTTAVAQNMLLAASASTLTVSGFTSTGASHCVSKLTYVATLPTTLAKTATGLTAEVIACPTYGSACALNAPAADKTALVGTHAATIKAYDWWNVEQTAGSLSVNVLISDANCENVGTATLTYNDAAAATYALNGADVEYPYSVTALVPNYCKYTIAADAVPTTKSMNTYVTNDATNKKFKLTKTTGPGTLAGATTLTATVTTLHGANFASAKSWSKTITVTDPCAGVTWTVTNNDTPVEYSIGAASTTVMTWSDRVSTGSTDTAWCVTERTDARDWAYDPTSQASFFSYTTANKVVALQSSTIAVQASIKVTGTLYFDGSIVAGPKTFYQIVKTKDECRPATYTLPTPTTSTTQNYYVGRTQEFVWDAFTISPSHCTITYKIDTTASGGFGDAFGKFTVDQANRKITIANTATWTTAQKKTYTIPINIQYTTSVSDSTLIDLNPAQTYNYVI